MIWWLLLLWLWLWWLLLLLLLLFTQLPPAATSPSDRIGALDGDVVMEGLFP